MINFIDDHRGSHGVEPICRVLPITPSTYHDHMAKRADPEKFSARAKRDEILKPEIARVFAGNFEVYGARKVWRQLRREGLDIARCTVERLMHGMGYTALAGVDRIHPDLGCELDGHFPHHGKHRPFAGVVIGILPVADNTGLRGSHQDYTTLSRHHVAGCKLTGIKCAVHIQPHDTIKVGAINFKKITAHRDTRVADQHIEAAECRQSARKGVINLGRNGNVHA